MSAATDTDVHAIALRYAERIEAEVVAVGLLRTHEHDDWAELPIDEREAVLAARRTLELDDPPTAGDGLTLDLSGDPYEGVEDWLEREQSETPLEVYRTGRNSGDGWETQSVVVVLGTGGPHVEVEYYGDRAEVRCYWGGDRARVPVDADAIAALYGVEYWYSEADADER